ncbi:NHX-3 protein, partial [Aphelenchoides avenae]
MEYTAFEVYLFASLISCTDPVAVIAVFEDLRINEFLYINVFGESLFNDGIAMVIYQMLVQLPAIGDSVTPVDYAFCFASFFYIAGGGILVGVAYAVLASLITKHSQAEPLVAPIVTFAIPYIGWLSTELFGLASILGTTACGIVMKQYVKDNMTKDAANSVKSLSRSIAVSIEALSFLFLGLTTTTSDHQWDPLFIVSTIACCTVYRIIAIVTMCSLLNRRRLQKFSAADQIVLCYGGLRGVIVFAMVLALPTGIAAKPMFFTATVALVCFTVFVQ